MERITLAQFEQQTELLLKNAHKVGGYLIEDPIGGDLVLLPKKIYDALVNQLEISTEILRLHQDLRALQNSMMTYQKAQIEDERQ